MRWIHRLPWGSSSATCRSGWDCASSRVWGSALSPGAVSVLAGVEYASVNLVVAVLIWVMIYPMMVNVDFASLRDVGQKPKGLCITLVVNWLIKPFTMAALGVLFFEYLFAGLVDPQDGAANTSPA